MINSDYWRTLQVQEFDTATFIQGVHDKYAGTNGGASIEALQRQWDATLDMPTEGDPSVCPYQSGVPRFALMEVWMKAADFWRAGYRSGDKLQSDQYGHALWPWMLELIGEGSKPTQIPSPDRGQSEPVQLELFNF